MRLRDSVDPFYLSVWISLNDPVTESWLPPMELSDWPPLVEALLDLAESERLWEMGTLRLLADFELGLERYALYPLEPDSRNHSLSSAI